MKIAIIANHSWPVQPIAQIPYTGDFFYALLAQTLDEMGHEITFIAPKGSYQPPHGQLLEMRASLGKYPPSSFECEVEALDRYLPILKQQEIIHDFSTTKAIVESLYWKGYTNTLSTQMGGPCLHPSPAHNVVAQSHAQAKRLMLGHTDYTGTPLEAMGGPTTDPIKHAKFVHDGIDTDFYHPTYNKSDYYLHLGRWHETRGYKLAIEIAKKTGIRLIMAGTHPDSLFYQHEKNCLLEAQELSKGCPNIVFFFLPQDETHHQVKRELYQQAKALLLTVQFHEPFGLGQVEALACGTPIVATPYGSMPEIIGDCGIIATNYIDNFIGALLSIDKINPTDCVRRARGLFDRKVMARNYLNLYEQILKGERW